MEKKTYLWDIEFRVIDSSRKNYIFESEAIYITLELILEAENAILKYVGHFGYVITGLQLLG